MCTEGGEGCCVVAVVWFPEEGTGVEFTWLFGVALVGDGGEECEGVWLFV